MEYKDLHNEQDDFSYDYWMDFTYHLKEEPILATAMRDLLRYLKSGGNKQQAIAFIEKHKAAVIKGLNTYLMYGRYTDADFSVRKLHDVGIDWAELDPEQIKKTTLIGLITLLKKGNSWTQTVEQHINKLRGQGKTCAAYEQASN